MVSHVDSYIHVLGCLSKNLTGSGLDAMQYKTMGAATLAQGDHLACLAADAMSFNTPDSNRADNLTESRQEEHTQSLRLAEANKHDPACVRSTTWRVDFEPVSLSPSTAPAKRFFRTFWRSAARRMLVRDRSTAAADIMECD